MAGRYLSPLAIRAFTPVFDGLWRGRNLRSSRKFRVRGPLHESELRGKAPSASASPPLWRGPLSPQAGRGSRKTRTRLYLSANGGDPTAGNVGARRLCAMLQIGRHMPHRLPVHAGRLHGDMRATVLQKASRTMPTDPPLSSQTSSPPRLPCPHRQSAPPPPRSSCGRPVRRNVDAVLPSCPPTVPPAKGPHFQGILIRVLHGPGDRLATVRGAPRSHGPTQDRASCTKELPTSAPTAPGIARFVRSGSAQPVGNSGQG